MTIAGPLWLLGVIALGVVVEGPVVTVVGGSLAGTGVVAWWAVWTIAVLADTASDVAIVGAGRYARGSRPGPRARRWQRRIGLTDERRTALTDRVATSLPHVVLGAKLVDVAALPAFVAVGLAGVPVRRFLLWAVPATAVRAGLLVALGAVVGRGLADELAARPWLLVIVGVAVAAVLLLARALGARVLAHRRNRRCEC